MKKTKMENNGYTGEIKSHHDWKKNYMIAQDYVDRVPQEFIWKDGSPKTQSYTFEVEKRRVEGKEIPWILWLNVYKTDLKGRCPLGYHQNTTDFKEQIANTFPFNYLMRHL